VSVAAALPIQSMVFMVNDPLLLILQLIQQNRVGSVFLRMFKRCRPQSALLNYKNKAAETPNRSASRIRRGFMKPRCINGLPRRTKIGTLSS